MYISTVSCMIQTLPFACTLLSLLFIEWTSLFVRQSSWALEATSLWFLSLCLLALWLLLNWGSAVFSSGVFGLLWLAILTWQDIDLHGGIVCVVATVVMVAQIGETCWSVGVKKKKKTNKQTVDTYNHTLIIINQLHKNMPFQFCFLCRIENIFNKSETRFAQEEIKNKKNMDTRIDDLDIIEFERWVYFMTENMFFNIK